MNSPYKAERRTLTQIKQRCYNKNNPDFKFYGAKGIVVCDRWLESFENFLDDMGPRPNPELFLIRLNPNGNYEPTNCQWMVKLRPPKMTREQYLKRQKESRNQDPYKAERRAWTGMKQRCTNMRLAGYRNYGGRGITVCERWNKSFELFLQDMGMRPSENHSLDRIDVNGNYEPMNCKWATRREQNINQRRIVKLQGTDCVKELCASVGITPAGVWHRRKRGMTLEEAIFTPKKTNYENGMRLAKPIIFNGVRYNSLAEAERTLSMDRKKIRKTCEYV